MNTLVHWWVDGGVPVHPATAEARAKICEVCPENRAKLWWEWAKDAIASCIQERLEVKNRLNMRVDNEEYLHMCRVCGCCCRLKVWTPLQYIKDQEKFPDHCWIRKGI